MALLKNASFQFGMDGWGPCNLPDNVSIGVMRNGTAKSGEAFLRASTTVVGGSVAQDFYPNGTEPCVGVLAWIRAAPGGPPVSGMLTIWRLDIGTREDVQFAATSDWTLVTSVSPALPTVLVVGGDEARSTPAPHGRRSTLTRQASPNVPRLRVEFYIDTTNADFDIDCVIAA